MPPSLFSKRAEGGLTPAAANWASCGATKSIFEPILDSRAVALGLPRPVPELFRYAA